MRNIQFVIRLVKNGDKSLLKGEFVNDGDMYVYPDRIQAWDAIQNKIDHLKEVFSNSNHRFVVAEAVNGKFTGN